MIEFAVDDELHRFTALGAGGSDLYFEGALPQLPLHEGRRNRVFRSGGVESLAAAKLYLVRRPVDGHWVSPGDSPGWISEDKGHAFLELVEIVPLTVRPRRKRSSEE